MDWELNIKEKKMEYVCKPKGVCAMQIRFDLSDDGIIKSVQFLGGCNGNTQGVAKLAEGRSAKEVIALLEGINCGGKGTSCPDQLAKALQLALNQ
jgi:uncharacterized protein (TIGR03905 family)